MQDQIRTNYPILIPYAVDFHTATTGKHISVTKRHARWRFGFAHIPSLLAHKTGVQCRGMELDIHVIWSITSGKFLLYVNSFPIFQGSTAAAAAASFGGGSNGGLGGGGSGGGVGVGAARSKLEHSLTLPESVFPGGHLVHIVAWALPSAAPKGHAQFSMTFDGQDYQDFFKLFQLGPTVLQQYQHVLDRVLFHSSNTTTNSKTRAPPSISTHTRSTRLEPSKRGDEHEVDTLVRGRPRYNSQGSKRVTHAFLPSAPPPPMEFPTLRQSSSSPNVVHYAPPPAPPAPAVFQDTTMTEEERKLIAQAKVRSFRDLRGTSSSPIRRWNSERPYHHPQNYHHASDHQSLDSGLSYSESSMPAFARPSTDRKRKPSPFRKRPSQPPPPAAPAPPAPTPVPLKPTSFPMENDLMDLHPPPTAAIGIEQSRPILRSTSSLTLDTMLRSQPGGGIATHSTSTGMAIDYDDKRDDMSFMADMPHLDPTQMWKTQQGLSFRLQNRPPVYADTAAGDLIQPSPSFQMSPMAPNPNTCRNTATTMQRPAVHDHHQQQGRRMESSPNMKPFDPIGLNPNFKTPEAPTWDSLNAAFVPQQQSHPHQGHY